MSGQGLPVCHALLSANAETICWEELSKLLAAFPVLAQSRARRNELPGGLLGGT